MKYQIWQIVLTDEQIEEANTPGTDMPEFFKKYCRTNVMPDASAIYDAIDMYEHVANIEVDVEGLNTVFHVGNMGPEKSIERLLPGGKQMHSISVGDIIIDEAGNVNYVDSMGFGQLFTKHFQEAA